MSQPMIATCPACETESYARFAELPEMPVHVGVLWESRIAAQDGRKGEVALAYCETCGFVGNPAFDPERVDYGLRYDNALHFSATFQAYEQETAQRLIDRYGIRSKRIAELGCGSGHFLSLICEMGHNAGIGFDPSYEPGPDPLAKDVRILRDYYSDEHAEHKADLVCCRHVLEHIPEPRNFLQMVRRSLEGDRDAIVYFEVPNAYLIFRDLSVWDVIYEHCNYFSRTTLEALFRSCGFEVLDVREPYQGQFLSIEARLGDHPTEAATDASRQGLAELKGLVDAFAGELRHKRESWSERLDAFAKTESTVVIWGGGAKTVSFLNLVRAHETIDWVVDINPGKQGSFIAGTGQPVVAPEKLTEIKPDVVVVMNAVYRGEIAAQLATMGLDPEILLA